MRVGRVETQGVVHDIGQEHLQEFVARLDDRHAGLEKLSPRLFFNLGDQVEAKPAVVPSLPRLSDVHGVKEVMVVCKLTGGEPIDRFRDDLLLEELFFQALFLI